MNTVFTVPLPLSNGGLLRAGARPGGKRPLLRTFAGPPLSPGIPAPAELPCFLYTLGSSSGASREALAQPQGPACASISLPWPRRGGRRVSTARRHARLPDGERTLPGSPRTTASWPTQRPPAPARRPRPGPAPTIASLTIPGPAPEPGSAPARAATGPTHPGWLWPGWLRDCGDPGVPARSEGKERHRVSASAGSERVVRPELRLSVRASRGPQPGGCLPPPWLLVVAHVVC
ncbi:Oral-Facial-Digital Syndrome 1 Protein [Manis pentadactyla]|nr:Oral-Facial-Digital Syndrome 1 Protein [Manis pentadactyla]